MLQKIWLILLMSVSLRAEWACDVLKAMSIEEKVGQLFMPGFRVGKADDLSLMHTLITYYHVGGILLLPLEKQTPIEQAQLIDELQQRSSLPLLISQDLEWGLSMRLKSVIRFPHNMTLGALRDKQLIYQLGKEIGRQCKLMGVHINFAPVVDINCNPLNPVIHDRSFGSDKAEVAERACLYMRGLHDEGVISCAKHFPGHGDTDVDSHYCLPIVRHSKQLLMERELYPFIELIQHGVPMIMTAHLHMPVLDDAPYMPASLSKQIVTDFLKQELGFNGIVVTDGLRMQGVSNQFSAGEAAVMAICAGNDLLIDSEDPREAIETVIKAVHDGIILESQLDASVLKIVRLKQSLGLIEYRPMRIPQLDEFHRPEAYQLKGRLYHEAVTLIRDRDALLPLSNLSSCAALFVAPETMAIHKRARESAVTTFTLTPDAQQESITYVEQELQSFETIIICLAGMNKYAHKLFGISKAHYGLIERLEGQGKKVIVILFGSPYALPLVESVGTVIVAYEDDIDAQFEAARVILGRSIAKGVLPIELI